ALNDAAQLRLLGSLEARPPLPRATLIIRGVSSGQGAAALRRLATISTSLSGPAHSTGSAKKDALRRCITTRAIGTCECVVISLDTLISRRCKRKLATPRFFLKKCKACSQRPSRAPAALSCRRHKIARVATQSRRSHGALREFPGGSSLVDGDPFGRGEQARTLRGDALLRRLED